MRNNSQIIYNGTFINSGIFPSLGYSLGELTDDKTREKYDLPKNKLKPQPSDSTALGNTYIAKDADWIDFEATVSTSKDQIAIAPRYLQIIQRGSISSKELINIGVEVTRHCVYK